MDLLEVRRHIQLQAYNLEHFITYDPKKVFKEQSNHNKFQKRKIVYDESDESQESDNVDKSFKEIKPSNEVRNKDNVSYDLNVEKDLYGIENEENPEIKALMKNTPQLKQEEIIIEKPNILSEKEQYLHDIEIARNSKKRKKLLSVIYE